MSAAVCPDRTFAPLQAEPERSWLSSGARSPDRGFVHSIHTGSALDGPGLRTVLWTTGCPLRCVYCHNPDMWKKRHGRVRHIDDVMEEIGRYERFMKITNGGITVSGGEPLAQAPFVANLFRRCKERGIHTVLDTSGYLADRLSNVDLGAIDLVLLDIKSWDPQTHIEVTGRPVEPVLAFARRLAALGKPAWIRFVLVPGLTDDPENVAGLARFVSSLSNVERVEVLPFHQMGRAKWERLGLEYALEGVAAPPPERVQEVAETFRRHGLEAV